MSRLLVGTASPVTGIAAAVCATGPLCNGSVSSGIRDGRAPTRAGGSRTRPAVREAARGWRTAAIRCDKHPYSADDWETKPGQPCCGKLELVVPADPAERPGERPRTDAGPRPSRTGPRVGALGGGADAQCWARRSDSVPPASGHGSPTAVPARPRPVSPRSPASGCSLARRFPSIRSLGSRSSPAGGCGSRTRLAPSPAPPGLAATPAAAGRRARCAAPTADAGPAAPPARPVHRRPPARGPACRRPSLNWHLVGAFEAEECPSLEPVPLSKRTHVVGRYRLDNPAGEAIGAALPKYGGIHRHQRTLPHGEAASAIDTVKKSDATAPVKLAFEFLVHTACRSGGARLACWDELSLEDGECTIPAERMKSKRDHRVPLSVRAQEILEEARNHTVLSDLVFPSPSGRALSDSALSKLLRELGVQAVPYGFRSSFRDWAAECTDARHAVMEAALSRVVRNKAEAAYARSDLFQRRRTLMNDWASCRV